MSQDIGTYPDPKEGEVLMPPVALIPRLLELRDTLTDILMMLGVDDMVEGEEEELPEDEELEEAPEEEAEGDSMEDEIPDPYSDYEE